MTEERWNAAGTESFEVKPRSTRERGFSGFGFGTLFLVERMPKCIFKHIQELDSLRFPEPHQP